MPRVRVGFFFVPFRLSPRRALACVRAGRSAGEGCFFPNGGRARRRDGLINYLPRVSIYVSRCGRPPGRSVLPTRGGISRRKSTRNDTHRYLWRVCVSYVYIIITRLYIYTYQVLVPMYCNVLCVKTWISLAPINQNPGFPRVRFLDRLQKISGTVVRIVV